RSVSFVAMIKLRSSSSDINLHGAEFLLVITGTFVWTVVIVAVNAMSTLWANSRMFLENLGEFVGNLRQREGPVRRQEFVQVLAQTKEKHLEEAASRGKYLVRKVKALPVLRLSVGGVYYLEKEAKL